MNIEHISSAQPSPEARSASVGSEQEVIDLQQIKSILYLGVKGRIEAPASTPHRVDTFA